MSFLRHKEIYPFDGGAGFVAGASAHRLDEFPADYSLAGWSPPVPASASPTASEYEAQPLRTSTDFQRTTGCVLTRCFSPGGKRTPDLIRLAPDLIGNLVQERKLWHL